MIWSSERDRDTVVFNKGVVNPLGRVEFPDELGIQKIKEEQERMLYQSSTEFAFENGGEWTNECLEILYEELSTGDWLDLRIDTRVHMLKPGWYPCIPGWHGDFIKRDDNGDLVYRDGIDQRVRHFALCSHSPTTKFLRDRQIEMKKGGWGHVSRTIEDRGDLEPYNIPAGELVEFNSRELHKGTKCEEAGWRYFFRATLFPPEDERRGETMDKIRWQTQVYAPENKGW